MSLLNLAVKAVGLTAFLGLVHLLIQYFTSPLKQIPGPFLAKFTNLWRFINWYSCSQIETQQALHRKHGSAVRLGPNMVSLADPDLVGRIYSTRGEFVKSDWYEVTEASIEGKNIETVFTTRSNAFHARYMKPYQKHFSMSSIIRKQHQMADVTSLLFWQLEHRCILGANAGQTVDLAKWLEYTAWEVDWTMTFGEGMGFVQNGSDVKNMIRDGQDIMRYVGWVGQMPWLDRYIGKNPYSPIKIATPEHAATYAYLRVMDRIANGEKRSEMAGDFLDNFLEGKETHPDIVGTNDVIMYTMINVVAGADTSGIGMKAIVYYVLTNPAVLAKLVSELDAASLSFPSLFEETRDLPYLNAVIKEGWRLHPPLTGPLERIVPASGLTLSDGRVIAPGTKVGSNPWVISHNKDVYGGDADVFRPERWLQASGENDQDFGARVKRMNAADLVFGGGNRICTGRHLALVQTHKVIADLFARYNVSLDGDRKQWSVRKWWIALIDDIHVKLELRPGVAAIDEVMKL